jgi:AraC-like DNA-binding protein
MAASAATYAARALQAPLLAARARGVDSAALLAAVGLAPELLASPEARVPLATVRALWDEAAARSGDVHFGLHAGEAVPRGAFGVLEYTAGAGATLGDGLRLLARYTRLVDQAAEVTLEVQGARATLCHALPGDPLGAGPHASAFILAGLLSYARQATGTPLAPLEVRLPHPAPADAREHARVFGGPVRFGAPDVALVLPASALPLPLATADAGLLAILQAHAEELLARLAPPAGETTSRVRALLLPRLAEGEPEVGAAARALGLSSRTLQRRLADEGATFREVHDALRRELALRHVGEGRLSLAEVAFLLGFQEPSAFHRAFRRWTGTTPGAWREAPPARER